MASYLATGLDHPEGIAWDPEAYLVAGGEDGQMYRVNLDGSVEEYAHTGGFCLGIALDGDSNAYVCDMGRSEVVRVTPEGKVTSYCSACDGGPLRVPNFPVFDDTGRLWISDSGAWNDSDGRIVAIEPDGRATVASRLASNYTNGLAISPDGQWLYVAESALPGVSRMRLEGSALGEPELVVMMHGTVPDGLAFDASGRLVIACYRPDAILLWDGKALATLHDDPQAMTVAAPTNIAFFGPDLSRLAVANLHGQFITEVDIGVAGAPLRRPRVG